VTRPRQRNRLAASAIIVSLPALAMPATAWAGALTFASAPALPTLISVTINAQSQTIYTTMTNLSISDTRGTKLGWNITVKGQAGVGKSAVFAAYCPLVKCGAEPEGYIVAGKKMAANSLKLNSTGASFTGGSGSAPTFQCSTACNIDSAAAVKIVSAATGGAGENTWTSTGLSTKSLELTIPTTLHALPAEQVYRVNILWTLATGP
jgi:hypothetical protein